MMKSTQSHPIDFGARPFLKWAGGKRQLLKQLRKLYPLELKSGNIKYYYEPFIGGGAVFFDVIQSFEIENAFLYDINEELILTYLVLQKDVDKLLDFLSKYEKTYIRLEPAKQAEYYYEIRESFNSERFNINYKKYSENWIPRAAKTIFLNKTCFNGLFRFNSKGAFNTPQGRYKDPKIMDEVNLMAVSKILEKARIKRGDFKSMIGDIKHDSFIYFDPPYRPLSRTSNFTSYSQFEFGNDKQLELASVFKKLHQQGCKLMLSNSDPKNTNPKDDFFDNAYADFNIRRIDAKRQINSVVAKRKSIKEIVVTNY